MTEIKPLLERIIIIAGWTFLAWIMGYIAGSFFDSPWSWLIPTITGIFGFFWGWKSKTMWIFI